MICFISSLQKVYKSSYEKARGSSINYCDTPKFQMDSVLKQFTHVRIKYFHKPRILSLVFALHHIHVLCCSVGTLHREVWQRGEGALRRQLWGCFHASLPENGGNEERGKSLCIFLKSNQDFIILFSAIDPLFLILQQEYKSDYEDNKTKCFYPQTLTPEYEVNKKLQKCNDVSSAVKCSKIFLLCW